MVGIGGPYRTGKSFLSNLLAKYLPTVDRENPIPAVLGPGNPFQVGHTVQACTRGVWMTILPPDPDTRKNSILLDLEGTNSMDRDPTFEVQLSSLGFLLCSVFVLNTTGRIDERSLESLESAVKFGELLHRGQGGPQGSAATAVEEEEKEHCTQGCQSMMQENFPHFGWVLRDFSLFLEDAEGRRLTPQEYLQQAIQHRPELEKSETGRSQNRLRRVLRESFPARQCFPMARPFDDEEHLRQPEAAPLRSKFLEDFRTLAMWIREQAPQKEIRGRPVSASELAGLARVYVDALNDKENGLPTLGSAWSNVRKTQIEMFLTKTKETVRQHMKHKFSPAKSVPA